MIESTQGMRIESAGARPGWPEILLALVIYLAIIIALALWMVRIPDAQAALRGIVGMAVNGIAGTVALLAAVALRIRDFRAFGFVSADRPALLAAAGLGLLAFGLSFAIEWLYAQVITEETTQADFVAAAKAGAVSLIALLISGALFTPFGEEVVFRGVVANALDRYGARVAVFGSALIFATAHGPSVIFFLALMVGIMAAILFRRTGSLWPPLLLHIVYNGLHLVHYAMQ